MSKALSIPADRKQRLLDKLLDRFEHGLEHGGMREATDIAKTILPHLLPPTKGATQQVLLAGAVDGGRLDALTKVNKRLASSTDATFTDVQTLHKGAN